MLIIRMDVNGSAVSSDKMLGSILVVMIVIGTEIWNIGVMGRLIVGSSTTVEARSRIGMVIAGKWMDGELRGKRSTAWRGGRALTLRKQRNTRIIMSIATITIIIAIIIDTGDFVDTPRDRVNLPLPFEAIAMHFIDIT